MATAPCWEHPRQRLLFGLGRRRQRVPQLLHQGVEDISLRRCDMELLAQRGCRTLHGDELLPDLKVTHATTDVRQRY